MYRQALADAELKIQAQASRSVRFAHYAQNPVGFVHDVLGVRLTPDIQRVAQSLLDNPVTIARSGNGTGKCVALNERIMLADGRMAEASELIGRTFALLTYGQNGEQYPELAYGFDNGVQDVYRVTTESGRTIVRTGNHPLLAGVLTRKYLHLKTGLMEPKEIEWKNVDTLQEGDIVGVPVHLRVPASRSRPVDEVKLAGYLLGDGGTVAQIHFTQQDGPAKDEFIGIVENMGCKAALYGEFTIWVSGEEGERFERDRNRVLSLAREWGIYGKKATQKCFPSWVWELPDDQLALFLNRLFSCDGWAYSRIGGKGGRSGRNQIGISLASERMVRDVEWAMLRLGIPGRVRARTMRFNSKEFPAWEWSIYRGPDIERFAEVVGIYGKEQAVADCVTVARAGNRSHVAKWPYMHIGNDYQWERVKSIEYLGKQPTVGITVRNTHTFLTTFIEHNSHAAAHLAIWFMEAYAGAQVYTAAAPPESNLKIMIWGNIGTLVLQKPELFSRYRVSLSNTHIERSPTEFITGVTIPAAGTREQRIARFSGKHAPAMLFIVDEGDAVPPEVYEGIETCMSGGFARLLILFNPKIKSGPVYKKEREKQANVIELTAFAHPNVQTGQDLIPGAVDRNTTVRRLNEWSRPLAPTEEPDAQCFEVPDFLAGCTATSLDGKTTYPPLLAGWRKITDHQLSYMVLAEYPAQSSQQLISEEWIARARANWNLYVAKWGEKQPKGTKARGGLDVADQGDDSNVFARRYGPWVAPLQTWSGVDLEVTSDKAAALYLSHDLEYLFIDATGVGAGVAPSARRKVRRAKALAPIRKITGVMVASSPTEKTELGEFRHLRDQLWWTMREWLRTDENAMLPPDDELEEELLVATYEVQGKYVRIMDKPHMKELLGRSPDRADALSLTFTPQTKSFKLELA
jgi:intein/homing endonuclease